MLEPQSDSANQNESPHDTTDTSVLIVGDRNDRECEVAVLLLTRREVVTSSGASLEITYQAISTNFPFNGKGGLTAGVNRVSNPPKASLGGADGHGRRFIHVSPDALQGHRVGTYLLSAAAQFLRQFPTAVVNSISLSETEAEGDNLIRRNRGYEQVGFVFDYSDPEHRTGRSRPMPASDLKVVHTWEKNMTEMTVPEYIKHLRAQVQHLKDAQSNAEGARERLAAELAAALQSPLLWGLRTFGSSPKALFGVAGVLIVLWGLYEALGGLPV
ncbi:TPA: hypothetical protein ACVGJS_003586 [Pseudomonas aeruginosa]